MDLGLRERRALVTGASSGLGLGCALALATEGCRVFICARGAEQLAATASKIGAAGFLVADVSRPDDIARLVDGAVKELGGLDILVTNTPNPDPGPFASKSDHDWSRNHEAILMSVVRLIRLARPSLAASDAGRIVNITSTAADEALPGRLFSSSYRAALHAMAKQLSFDLAAEGVTINNIAPGNIRTPQWDEESAGPVAAAIPLGRLGLPEEVGALCAYLCSEQAAYITGQTITIDGGLSREIR
jgi:3-oxoacyl-[acyl-carrier protein] reductase